MSEKFWLWVTGIAFAAVIAGALLYALARVRECEQQGGTMVRSFALSGWSCVQFPLRPGPAR